MSDQTARAYIEVLQVQMKYVTDFLARTHPVEWSGEESTTPTVTIDIAEVEAGVLEMERMGWTPDFEGAQRIIVAAKRAAHRMNIASGTAPTVCPKHAGTEQQCWPSCFSGTAPTVTDAEFDAAFVALHGRPWDDDKSSLHEIQQLRVALTAAARARQENDDE